MSDSSSASEGHQDPLEDEPEVDCDKWDSDCKVINVAYEGNTFMGYEDLSAPSRIYDDEPPCKQIKTSVDINDHYTHESFIKKFREHWESKESLTLKGAKLISDPFKVCVIKDFLKDKSLLERIREEFYDVEWHKRNMDLYEFFQSSDLKHLESFEFISKFYNFLTETVMTWVSKMTGLELIKVSATCSLYGDTDYLLVHDDHNDDRMVAFVIYLNDCDWEETYGGGLQLFSKDENGQPFQSVKEIPPSNNQFIFFQVTDDSYHQVAEVTCKNDCRLSINGWFHSKEPPVFQAPVYQLPISGIFSKNSTSPQRLEIDISDWISEEYLNDEIAEEVQNHIMESSEISLGSFFKNNVVQAVLEDLNSESARWSKAGPPNRFSYLKLEETDLPQVLERLLLLFKSEQMFRLLKKYTNLDLSSVKYEMQKWEAGDYMLLSDYNWSEKNELDLVLYLGCLDGSSVVGGRMIYVATDEEEQEALITIEPRENCLNIIYRDTARFVKYFSKQSRCECFYILICSYSE